MSRVEKFRLTHNPTKIYAKWRGIILCLTKTVYNVGSLFFI